MFTADIQYHGSPFLLGGNPFLSGGYPILSDMYYLTFYKGNILNKENLKTLCREAFRVMLKLYGRLIQ